MGTTNTRTETMNRPRIRLAVAASMCAAVLVVLGPMQARASADYYSRVVAPSHAAFWSPGDAVTSAETDPNPSTAHNVCASADAGGNAAANDLVAGGTQTVTGSAYPTVGPFAGDDHPNGTLTGMNSTYPGQPSYRWSCVQDFGPTTGTLMSGARQWANSFWFYPESAGTSTVERDIYASSYTYTNGGTSTGYYPDNGAIFLNSLDGWANICIGQKGYVATHCSTFGRVHTWTLITLVYDGDASTLTLWMNDTHIHTLSGLTDSVVARQDPQQFGGGNGATDNSYRLWGVGIWLGAFANWLVAPCSTPGNPDCTGSGDYMNFMFLDVGGPPPGGTVPGCGDPGGPTDCTVGPGGTVCSQIGIISGDPKLQLCLPRIAATDCSSFSWSWTDPAGTFQDLSCNFQNGIIVPANWGIGIAQDVANVGIDIVWPSTRLMNGLGDIRTAAATHVPFNYVTGGISALPVILTGTHTSGGVSFVLPSPWSFTVTASWAQMFGFAEPHRSLFAAFLYLNWTVAVILAGRRMLS